MYNICPNKSILLTFSRVSNSWKFSKDEVTLKEPGNVEKERRWRKTKKNRKTNEPSHGTNLSIPSCSCDFLISNIIITNKNKTAMAPTYTIMSVNPKNSEENRKKTTAALQKLNIKKSTEFIGVEENPTK